jgi:tetratricopeptide (TPR) repeat protein
MEAYDRGDRFGAFLAWTNVVSINPNNDSAYYSRAIAKADLRNLRGAMQDYDRAIELDPEFWKAWENRACLKDDMGDHAGAIDDHSRVIANADKGRQTFVLAYANRGNSKLRLGDLVGACADWRKARELGEDSVSERIEKYCKDCG